MIELGPMWRAQSTGEKGKGRANNEQRGQPWVHHTGDHQTAPRLSRAYAQNSDLSGFVRFPKLLEGISSSTLN